jgi:hypothetical protein
MLDRIHCPQKGMAQASKWGGLLRTGYLPYLLLRRLRYTFLSNPLLSPRDFARNVTSTTYLIATIQGASRETRRLEVVAHPCDDVDEVDLEDISPNASLQSHLKDA